MQAIGSQAGNQNPHQSGTAGLSGAVPPASPPQAVGRLWSPREYQEFLGVGERTYLEMEAKGLLADAVLLGPRTKRYVPSECMAKVLAMPRDKAPEPAQLRRARIEKLKSSGASVAAA